MKILIYNDSSNNIVARIPKLELIANANRVNRIGRPYSNPNGSDINSLLVDIDTSRIQGKIEWPKGSFPVKIEYNINTDEAVVRVIWKHIKRISDKVVLPIIVSGKYSFHRTIELTIIKIDSFFKLNVNKTIVSRDKKKIGEINFTPIVSTGNCEEVHKLSIDRHERLTESTGTCKIQNNAFVYEIPYSDNKDIGLYYDFGDNDANASRELDITGVIDGTSFSEKITVEPYSPTISADLKLLHTEINLCHNSIEIAELLLKSDARKGGIDLEYDIKTSSSNVFVKNHHKGVIKPNQVEKIILAYEGDIIKNSNNQDPIVVNILNNDEKVSEITFSRKSIQSEKNNVVQLKAKKIGEWKNYKETITLTKGTSKVIKYSFIPKYDIDGVIVKIINGGSHISLVNNNQPFNLIKGQTYDVYVKVDSEIDDNASFSIVVSAEYYQDLTYKTKIKKKEPICPKVSLLFNFKEEGKNKEDNKRTIYRTDEKVLLGKLTLKSSFKEDNHKDEDYAFIDLKTLIVVPDSDEGISFDLEPCFSDICQLKVGEETSYDVLVNIKNQDVNKIKFNFKVITSENKECSSKDFEITIRDKCPQELPNISFKQNDGDFIYPNVKEKTYIGIIKIEKKSFNVKKELERTDGILRIESDAFFFEKGTKEISINDIDECPLYFDTFANFEGKDNIEEKQENVTFSLKYRDSITTEWQDIMVNNNSIQITQRDSTPIPQLIYIKDRKECLVNNDFKSGVIYLGDIGYTNRIKDQGKRKLFELNIKNAQQISIPKKKFEIKNITCSVDCIEIEGLTQYEFVDKQDVVSYVLYMNWCVLNERYNGELDGFEINIDFGELGNYVLKVNVSVFEQITSEWVSLDLGTSAIVMAKKVNGEVEPIPLIDVEKGAIESHPCIISSNIVFKELDNEGNHELILSPERRILNRASAILPPIKFVVGQDRLPFYDYFRKNKVKSICNNYINTTVLEEVKPNELLQSVYCEVFDRMPPSDRETMRKLILTYPSTYTIDQIKNLKNLISKKFNNIKEKNILFVPESDAVLAYYIGTKRVSNGGRALNDGERIIIYDMGAGTLDISYIKISRKDKITATIEKRIGIPIAGNYLDYCLYKAISARLPETVNFVDLKRTIQDLKKQIEEGETPISSVDWKEGCEKVTYNELIKSNEVQDFLKKCTSEVFSLLLGEHWKKEVDTFVYSGRGCMFKPLISHIKNISSDNKWTIERVSDSDDEMKLCAAKGAVKYEEMFASDSKQPFRIISFRQYASFGLVYCSYNENMTSTYKCKILKSAKEYTNAIDGIAETNSGSIKGIDIRPQGRMIVVQSYLDEDRIAESYNNRIQKKNDNDGCFISEIFSVLREDLGIDDTDLCNAEVEYNLDNNSNTISCTIQGQSLRSHQFSESIENNQYYKDGMWPFNN